MDAVARIKAYQQHWFEKIQPYLLASNLNVGSGHGFFSQIARNAGYAITSLEVAAPEAVVDRDQLILYDGKRMPFADNEFEVSLAMYVLHHAPNPEAILVEMMRVSSKRIILVEELYRNLYGKARLALLDYSVNTKGGLKSKIYWNSYLIRRRLFSLVEKGEWKLVHEELIPDTGFDLVLWIVDKI